MAHSEKISELVQTVRILNWEVRPKIANSTVDDEGSSALHKALSEIRDNEIQTSQLIRGMSLAESTAEDDIGEIIEHVDAATIGPRQILSEFGTAREAILSILRNLTEDEWSQAHETPQGSLSYEDVVDRLIESDRNHMGKIQNASS